MEAPNRNSSDILARFAISYGAMTTVLSFIDYLGQIRLQSLSQWWYKVNMARIQTTYPLARINTYKQVFFHQVDDSSLFLYDVEKNHLVQKRVSEDATFPFRYCFVQTPGNQIFFLGGKESDRSCYELVWDRGAYARRDRASMLYPRVDHSVCALDLSRLVVTGSNLDPCKAELYDIDSDEWIELPQLHTGRSSHSSCSFSERFVFVFGGLSQEGEDALTNSIERLDLVQTIRKLSDHDKTALEGWQTIEISEFFIYPGSVWPAVCQVSRDKILIAGGRTQADQLDATYFLDVPSGELSYGPDWPT